MATSGTTTFLPDIGDIIEEAYEQAGLEARTGYDYRTARRSIDLMMLEWQNLGINLWTIEQGSQVLTPGTANYVLPAATVDIIEHVLRIGTGTNQIDYNLRRISVSEYAAVSNKNQQARPVEIYVQRTETPSFTLWPIPDSVQTYTVIYWRMRRVQDTGTPANNTMDVPTRFVPALIQGLAYRIAAKKVESAARVAPLKALYQEAIQLAMDEDRDRSSIYVTPYVSQI